MTEYINKEQLLAHLYSKQDESLDVMKEIAEFPSTTSISREQVEKVRGEWLHDPETGYECCKKCRHTIYLNDYLNGNPPPFCEFCGVPMTDKAVDMVMERLEAMKDADD